MREIKFRGKRVDNGEWVYGVPVIGLTSGVFMVWIESEAKRGRGELSIRDVVKQAEVIPETVGQSTGLEDRDGDEIFEGDFVWIEHDITETQSLGSIENKDLSVWEEVVETFEVEDVVVFVNGSFNVQEWVVGTFMPYEVEVIGNIHDNPELMEARE